MKSLIYVFVAIAMLGGLFFSPAITPPVAAAACGDTSTVQRGDYLSKIARTCGIALADIIGWNPQIKDINKIYPGQVINLKSTGTIPVTGTGTYTVVRGDYLSLIAVRFNTTVTELLRLNPEITNPSLLYVGQVIRIPNGSSTSTSNVTLSTRSVKKGATFTVTVTGFPTNTDVTSASGKMVRVPTVVDSKTDAKAKPASL